MKDCGECSFSGWMQRAAVLSKDHAGADRVPVLGAHVRTASAAPRRRVGKRARAATGRHALLLRPLAD